MFSKNCDKKSAFQALLAYCQTFLYSILLFVVIIPTYPTSALKAETLYEYGLNNIFYYDPEGENCDDTPSSNGKYKAAQYSFTEEQLKNGEVCELLNAGQETAHWTQTDNYPVPFVAPIDDEDGIANLNVNDNANDGAIYDLSGRRINSQPSTLNSQLRKGIYIVNGKKVLF